MMIINRSARKLYEILFVGLTIMALTVSAASSADTPVKKGADDWKKVVEAAKKEGSIVICGDPSEIWRQALVEMFRQDYPEITVEYTGSTVRDFWPRLRQERKFGKKLWDLAAAGVDVLAYAAKKDGLLEPIRPLLLPEIADDSKWIGGVDNLFGDREKKFMPTYTMTIKRTSSVNRDIIKEAELKSSEQLIEPKFKGKIVMQTPTGGGAGLFALGNMGYMYGENWLRDLLFKQNAVITDDKRQQAEWVVRGKYPIAIGLNETSLVPFEKQGLGKNVTTVDDKITPVGTGLGSIFFIKDAPHPNASRLFINWILSKNVQLKLTKAVQLNSRRTDVPPVVKELAIDPAHFSNYYHYSTEENTDNSSRFLPIINEFIKK